jgi:hypothetical protein
MTPGSGREDRLDSSPSLTSRGASRSRRVVENGSRHRLSPILLCGSASAAGTLVGAVGWMFKAMTPPPPDTETTGLSAQVSNAADHDS